MTLVGEAPPLHQPDGQATRHRPGDGVEAAEDEGGDGLERHLGRLQVDARARPYEEPGHGGESSGQGPRAGEDPPHRHPLGHRHLLVDGGGPHGQPQGGAPEEGPEEGEHGGGGRQYGQIALLDDDPAQRERFEAPGVAGVADVRSDEVVGEDAHHDVDADGEQDQGEDRLAHQRPDGQALDEQSHEGGEGHGQDGGQHEGEADDGGEVGHEPGAQDHEARLGEVEHPGGFEDDGEAEGEQGVDAALAEPGHARLEEAGHPATSSATPSASSYIASTMGPNKAAMADRFTFWVAVSSPSSWSSCLGRSRNRRTR